MKPINRKNYGSIPHLSNSKLGSGDYFIAEGQERILTKKKRDSHDNILVFEKYDGSNVGIAKKNGRIYSLVRMGYEATSSPYKQHHIFAEWVRNRESLFSSILSEGERIVGEWLLQAHGLIYDLKQDYPIVFFDWYDKNNQRKLFSELEKKLGLYNLPLPRLIHTGEAIEVEKLIPILNLKTDAISSKDDPEGMVYRVERNGKVDFLAKWVRGDFDPGKYLIGINEDALIFNMELDKV